MIGRLLCLTALLLPGVAHSADPKAALSATGVPSGLSVPAGAAAAGFTTLALNSDFTQQLPTNWLGGCPNGPDGLPNRLSDNTGHIWWNNIWWAPTNSACNVTQRKDPHYGGLVLDIPWLVAKADSAAKTLQTGSWDYDASKGIGEVHSFPKNAYYEQIAQSTPNAPSNGFNMITWGVGGMRNQSQAGIEWDVVETSGSDSRMYDSAVHNWGAGGTTSWIWTSDQLRQTFPNYDASKYHTFGLRTTSDGTNDAACGYVDNVLINCVPLPGGLTDAEKTEREFVLMGLFCFPQNYNGSCPLEGQVAHMLVKSVRVWSCKDWQTSQCNGPVLSGAP
jgi:hypothetical protein